MRCTQLVGLPNEALKFIEDNINMISCNPCPHCGKNTSEERDCKSYADASDAGMFDDGPQLMEYKLKDGCVVREEVQAAPWSSGPNIFLMLVDDKGTPMYVWPEEAIDNA